MNKKFLNLLAVAIVSLLLVSCAGVTPTSKGISNEKAKSDNNKKRYPAEDTYILFALRAEKIGDSKTAAILFYDMYEKSKRKEYLYRSLSNNISSKNYQRVIEVVESVTKGSLDDFKLVRLKIIALLQMKKYDEALLLSTNLVEKSKETADYILTSDIYIKQKKYNIALKYLESAYVKEYDKHVLDKMAILLYVDLGRKKEAIAQLETHSRLRGCSELICGRLIGFYSKENNIDGILSTYLRMYDKFKKPEIASKIIQIYGYKKDYIKMIDFLEKSKTDDETLLQLYAVTKNYKKAFGLADKLYAKDGDITFLGQSAIYEYESSKTKKDNKTLNSVIKKLTDVVKIDKNPLYENYLGYILIDHEVDVKKGMKYIKDVLKIEPNSAFYLDSLAWGYFKLGQCKQAKTIMDRVVTLEGGDDPEVMVHVSKIDSCVKNKKVKN
jgi:predicted Zn-dependent protease